MEQMSCDLITTTSTCCFFKTTADRVNLSSVPETRENFTCKEKNLFLAQF